MSGAARGGDFSYDNSPYRNQLQDGDGMPDTMSNLPAALPAPGAGATAEPSPPTAGRLREEDRARLERYFGARHAAGTVRAYRSDWGIFAAWCETRSLRPLPGTPETLAAFLASEADAGRAVSTIRRRLAAIRLAHRICAYPSPTASELVAGTLRGIARTLGSAPQPKTPALAEDVRAMIDATDAATRRGLRDRAILGLGFGGAFRRGELAALCVEDLEETAKGLRVSVRRSKTDPESRGQIVAVIRGESHCPVRAVSAWQDAAGVRAGALFRRLYRGDRVGEQGLSGHSVGTVVKRAAAAAGLDASLYGGHSLRAGFLTSAAQANASLFRMMDVSRHRDPRTVMRYIRMSEEFEDHAGTGLL